LLRYRVRDASSGSYSSCACEPWIAAAPKPSPISTPHRRGVDLFRRNVAPRRLVDDAPDAHDAAAQRHAERTEECARDGAERDPHRGLPRARALEDVAQIFARVLDPADAIGVSGARHVNLPRRRRVVLRRVDAHDLRPTHVVFVFQNQRDRRADRHPAPHAADDPHLVGLDVLPVPAPVAQLAPPRLPEQHRGIDRETARNPFDDPDQRRPMRLPRRKKPQPAHDAPTLLNVTLALSDVSA
jgi:hypothetical protein